MLSEPTTMLITGGTAGIGRALTRQLHREGHRVIVAARDKIKLAGLQGEFPGVIAYQCDLSARRQVESLADNIVQNHPDLSILVNNAGIQNTPAFLDQDFSYDSIDNEMTINFLAPVWLTSLLLPLLVKQEQGAVVNVSSALVLAPKTTSAIYSASKAAIHSFSQSLRYQLEGTNILSIEAFMPLVDTAMTRGRGSGKVTPEYAAGQIIKGIKSARSEIYIGKTKLIRGLMRISPTLVKGILKRS